MGMDCKFLEELTHLPYAAKGLKKGFSEVHRSGVAGERRSR